MSDLISRSALLEALMKEEKECEDCMVMPSWYLALRIIENQPTAYDVDKVVKQFEEQYGVKQYDGDDLVAYEQAYIHIDEAIEIVKGGGVNAIRSDD